MEELKLELPDERKVKTLYVGVFTGIGDTILKLNVSHTGFVLHPYPSENLTKFLESITPVDAFQVQTLMGYEDIFKRLHKDIYESDMFVLTPSDVFNPVHAAMFSKFLNILLIIQPSNVKLYAVEHFFPEESQVGKYHHQFTENYNSYIQNSISVSIAKMELDKIDEINEFIKLAWDKPKLDCLQFALSYYNKSFYQWSDESAFIDICIAMESLTTARTEITNQISRLVAVLNSNTKEEGEIIYNNFKRLYELRSAIVHGAEFQFDREYFNALFSLMSRTMIQLITYSIGDREQLNKFVQQNGYGDIKNFKSEQKQFILNQKILDIIKKPLPKLKNK